MISAGIADPYWYEWYVGLSQVISMLEPDSNIESVIFQKADYDAIDDVVVKYKDGRQEYCYQVKHEIESSNSKALTFNRLVTIENQKKGSGKSLLNAIATGWYAACERTGKDITPVLFTNRILGVNKTQRTYKGITYKAIPLGDFLIEIKKKLTVLDKSRKLSFTKDERDLSLQWQEFSNAVSIPYSSVITFLDKLSIQDSQATLSELREALVVHIGDIFKCSSEIAEKLYNRLVAELQIWTTTIRTSEEITIDTVYETLSTKIEISSEQHRLAPPSPFFESRVDFCDIIVRDITDSNTPVVFISGEPGSGKTSIISHLQSVYDFFTIRYHAFRPISPEQRFYNLDMGLCEPRQLWTEMMIQIRSNLKGKLHKHQVPVLCEFMTDIELRAEVLRLLDVLHEENGKPVFICIDGIDHAARSNLPVTFLSALYSPEEITAGVCFVIVGQPSTLYDKYPPWLHRENTSVKHIEIPPLVQSDIAQLIKEKTTQYSDDAERVAQLVYSLTKGNNLSVVYAIETIKKFKSYDELVAFPASDLISHDVNQYYENIWQHIVGAIISKNVVANFAESKVANAILLLNGRIYTRLLQEALKDITLTLSEWDQLMDTLYPLVIKGSYDHEYNLFHNDFRVYLMGIAQKHLQIYKDSAYQIAQYLHESDWGIIKYRNLLPLLICAEKTELSADYFTVSFVTSALAEGLSYYELDEFAETAYSEAVRSQQILKYHSVYLSIATLHQHRKYYQYYDRKYSSADLHDIIPVDISEIRAKSLIIDNVDDYYDALNRCQRFISIDTPEMRRRAYSLYELWFGSKTPLLLLKTLYPKRKYPENVASEPNLEQTLRLWGEVSAQLSIQFKSPLNNETSKLLEYEAHSEIVFGDAYFTFLLENAMYKEAIASMEYVRLSVKTVAEKLDTILLNGKADLFADVLEILQARELENSAQLYAAAILLVANPLRIEKIQPVTINPPIQNIYDSNTLTAVAASYVNGSLNAARDDLIIIEQANSFLNLSDDSISRRKENSQLKLLMRIASLLGKYNHLIAKNTEVSINGDVLYKQLKAFFDKPAARSFDFSKAFRFLLYTILNTPAIERTIDINTLFLDLRHTLLSFDQLGMFYKSIILDFLIRHNRQDIVREYLIALYGASGEKLTQQENWVSSHEHFLKYSSAVIPEISDLISARQKWDVVSYSGHEETAIGMPLEVYKVCSAINPVLWEAQGIRLNNLSAFADKFSNQYSSDVNETLSMDAIRCGLSSFWKLHNLSNDYHYNLSVLHEQLNDLLLIAKTKEDIYAVWVLSCGILSWYNTSDIGKLQSLYNACSDRAKMIGIESFAETVVSCTPSHYSLVSNESFEVEKSYVSDNDYRIQEETRRKAFEEEIKSISTDAIIENYISASSRIDEWPNIDIAWREILGRGEMSQTNAIRIMSLLAPKLQDRQWKYHGCEYIIKQLKEHLKYEAFWSLAEIIGNNLSEYDYEIFPRNASYLLLLFSDMFSNDMLSMLDAELVCQERWLSGDGHIPFPAPEPLVISSLHTPETLNELALSILLEQFELSNVHRNEIALPGIYALCKYSPQLYDWLVQNWNALVPAQINALILICERWGREAPVGTVNLINLLKEISRVSNKLTEKMKLYSILSKYAYALNKTEVELTFDAAPDPYVLTPQKPHTPIDDSWVPVGIKAFLMLNSSVTKGYDSGLDIIKYIRNNIHKVNTESLYTRSGDSLLVINEAMNIIDPVLYGEELAGRWEHLPLEWQMQYFLDIDDSLVTTTPPKVTYDKVWDIEGELEKCIKKR